MGRAGRCHVEQRYDRVALAREYRKILDCARWPPMRLLVTGGSGFLGGYVLDEAARRGHETVALARSEAAAGAVARRGAQPLTGDLDDPAAAAAAFGAARCEALVNLASLGFGHAPAIVAATQGGGHRPRGLRLHHGGDDDTPGPLEAGPAGRRAGRSGNPG